MSKFTPAFCFLIVLLSGCKEDNSSDLAAKCADFGGTFVDEICWAGGGIPTIVPLPD